MFDFWKPKLPYLVPEPKETRMPSQQTKDIAPHYLIGPDSTNGISFRIGDSYGSSTLSMSPGAVADLIQQLAVMIRKEYEVTIHAVDPEEKP